MIGIMIGGGKDPSTDERPYSVGVYDAPAHDDPTFRTQYDAQLHAQLRSDVALLGVWHEAEIVALVDRGRVYR